MAYAVEIYPPFVWRKGHGLGRIGRHSKIERKNRWVALGFKVVRMHRRL